MIIKKSVRCTDDSFPILAGIPSYSEARRNVIGIAGNALGDPQRILRGLRERINGGKGGRQFYFVTYAIIQREVGTQTPAILNEAAERDIGKCIVRIAYTLNEV